MAVYVADAHAHVQRLVLVVKMASVLKECSTEDQRSGVHFLWAEWLAAKDNVSYLRWEVFVAVHNWVEKFYQGRSKVTDDVRPGAEVAETTVKRLLCCGFQSDGTSVSVEDMSRNKCFSPHVRTSHVLRSISICDVLYILLSQNIDTPISQRVLISRHMLARVLFFLILKWVLYPFKARRTLITLSQTR
jgi:hypothetical protein